jgi:hypothetical protein
MPRLDGRRALDGDAAPGVELDDCDSRSACPFDVLNLHGVRPRREPDLAVQHSRRDDCRMRATLCRDANDDTGVILLQQGECFFPFHLISSPNVEVWSFNRNELGTYNAARGDESSRRRVHESSIRIACLIQIVNMNVSDRTIALLLPIGDLPHRDRICVAFR